MLTAKKCLSETTTSFRSRETNLKSLLKVLGSKVYPGFNIMSLVRKLVLSLLCMTGSH